MNIANALAELNIVISLTNILNIIKVIQERKEVEIEIQKIIIVILMQVLMVWLNSIIREKPNKNQFYHH